jgi:rubrerythrin
MQKLGTSTAGQDDFVPFWSMGARAKGEFQCSDCGYGVTVHSTLPRCPMCGGSTWERAEWHPFTRERQLL